MENRVGVLEEQMDDMKYMLKTLIEKMHTQSVAIGELSKQVGKKAADTTVEVSSER
jgi:regulator of replication initiation timing